MPAHANVNVDIPHDLLEKVPEASSELTNGVIKALIEKAKAGPVNLTIRNTPGQPFRVITHPTTGALDWGVGGS
jgi:hypothetical protein